MRERSKSATFGLFYNLNNLPTTWTGNMEYMREDPVANGNYVFHSSTIPKSGTFKLYKSDRYSYRSLGRGYSSGAPTAFPFDVAGLPAMTFDWDRTVYASEFNLIMLLTELKDTLDLFKIKFWRELSYGRIAWEVLPFVSELKAIARAAANLSVYGFSNPTPYEASQKTFIDKQRGYLQDTFVGEVKSTASGSITVPDILVFHALLDYIGFHPDLETAWDMFPLSFLMNGFLPLGDMIDNVVSRGWLSHVSFSGWYSTKSFYQHGHSYDPHSGPVSFYLDDLPYYRCYERRYLTDTLLVNYESPTLLQAELPSTRTMFEALFILRGARLQSFDNLVDALTKSKYTSLINKGKRHLNKMPPVVDRKLKSLGFDTKIINTNAFSQGYNYLETLLPLAWNSKGTSASPGNIPTNVANVFYGE
jgi:hypothetical protein